MRHSYLICLYTNRLLIWLSYGFCCLGILAGEAHAQKYNFTNYGVAEGLIQSQAFTFTQDQHDRLWIGTLGGISIFDGLHFENYNRSKGLHQNAISSLDTDTFGNIWMTSPAGLTKYDGYSFRYFNFAGKDSSETDNAIAKVLTDKENNIWLQGANLKIYIWQNDSIKLLPQLAQDTVIAIERDAENRLWLSVFNKGIYIWENGELNQVCENKEQVIYKMAFSNKLQKMIFLAFNNKFFVLNNGLLEECSQLSDFKAPLVVLNYLEDRNDNLWISGNDGGVWKKQKGEWQYFNFSNGFTDDQVTAIYEDNTGNIWLATNGSGIYRYAGSPFVFYDRQSGFGSPTIMSIAQTKDSCMYFSSNLGEMYELKNDKIKQVHLPLLKGQIATLTNDPEGDLFLATYSRGIWQYHNKQLRPIINDSWQNRFAISHINTQSINGLIWISSASGLKSWNKEQGLKNHVTSSVFTTHYFNEDTLLVSSYKGLMFYDIKQEKLIEKVFLPNTIVSSIASNNNYIFIGTDDMGLLIWDKKKRNISIINTKQGLSCDYIYSLLYDKRGFLWIGTGCGIDRIAFKEKQEFEIKNYGKSDGVLGVENNANAIYEDLQGRIWFGTTKGVFCISPSEDLTTNSAPKIYIKEVLLFSHPIRKEQISDSLIPFSNIPYHPVFSHRQNHLTFKFCAVHLSNAERVRFRYQLVGIDPSYNETELNTVIYPNLPSGEYTFRIWASDADGKWYDNALNYHFMIKAPFYDTLWFKILLATLCLALILSIAYFRNLQKEKRIRWKNNLRKKELERVRQSTAEDFHDEIGNKLTRINLLANIAESKIKNNPTELQPIIKQIKDNAASLYSGAKDIIWSLQPESSHLNEIIFRIKHNAVEMFRDSSITFEYKDEGWTEKQLDIELPIDYSRNLIMIFKEAINNVVKHAEASKVTFEIKLNTTTGVLFLILKDNGTGFEEALVSKGKGLKNMRTRANRINATFAQISIPKDGTTTSVSFKMPGNEGIT